MALFFEGDQWNYTQPILQTAKKELLLLWQAGATLNKALSSFCQKFITVHWNMTKKTVSPQSQVAMQTNTQQRQLWSISSFPEGHHVDGLRRR
mmetsp:Transcript_26335/g.63192  ORF Transcript_26335/g.63192 Transcript_26335/m.63192 type:complete len:93 (-) Transcript_26335:914-1192(-)